MSLKILILEDEVKALKNMKLFFEVIGYTVFTTPQGGEALEIIEKEKPDVVLCDLHLKGSAISGTEVLEETYDKHPEIKFIIISGYIDDPITRDRCMQCSPYLLLDKPIVMKNIAKALEDISKERG